MQVRTTAPSVFGAVIPVTVGAFHLSRRRFFAPVTPLLMVKSHLY
jgi:hypothetical protein